MIIENNIETSVLQDNTIIGDDLKLDNSRITFKGKGNMLFAEPNVTLKNSNITFCGDNALVYLSSSNKPYIIKIDIWREACAAFGKNSYFNGVFSAIVSERCNLIVGKEGCFSFGIWLRTADPHLIYDATSFERTNMSKSIIIGDHVWIGQNALILKGCRIGSGSIVSASCVLAGKTVESNSVYAGNPGKKIKDNIFFIAESVHNYTKEQSDLSKKRETKSYIYHKDNKQIDLNELDQALQDADTAEEKLDIIKSKFIKRKAKNRLYIAPQLPKKQGILSLFKRKTHR